MNIVLVKFGKKYRAKHVNKLAHDLKSIGQVYCYTENPEDVKVECIEPIRKLNGVWNKLAMFSPDFPIKGKILYVDLDVIVNYVPKLIQDPGNDLYLIHNNRKKDLIGLSNYDTPINSSVMVFDNTKKKVNEIWEHFSNSGLTDYFVRKYAGIDRYIHHEQFKTLPLFMSSSWKYDLNNDRPFTTFEESYEDYLQEFAEHNRRNIRAVEVR